MVRATRTFIAHLDNQHRVFKRHEEIPKEWEPSVGTRSLVDGDLPHLGSLEDEIARKPQAKSQPGDDDVAGEVAAAYDAAAADKNIDGVIGWVLDDSQPGDKMARARYARKREGEGKERAGALAQLAEIIATAAPKIQTSTDPELDDPSLG